MAVVYLSLGSNIERQRHLTAALDALQRLFGELTLSSVYESEAVGFAGSAFYNMVVRLETELTVGALAKQLRAIEHANGRRRDAPKFSSRTLDIDILTYDALVGVVDGITLPRAEITRNAFVLQPLAEIAPQERHPQTGQRYQALWQAYDKQQQRLWPVDFHWQGRQISWGSV